VTSNSLADDGVRGVGLVVGFEVGFEVSSLVTPNSVNWEGGFSSGNDGLVGKYVRPGMYVDRGALIDMFIGADVGDSVVSH